MMSSVFARRLGVLSVAVAVALCACGTTQASLLWYDGFTLTDDSGDYVVDTRLETQSGGSGTFFNNPWDTSWLGNTVAGTSLSRPGLTVAPVGGHAATPYRADEGQQVGRSYREFASPWGGFTDPDGTYYMGFLAKWGTGPVLHHRAVEMYSGDPTNDEYRYFQLGFSEWTGLGNELTMMVEDAVDGTEYFATLAENVNFKWDLGTTHYAVLKFEMSTTANDVISVYLDPVGTTEPSTPSAQISVGQFLASHMTANTQFTWGPQFQQGTGMDELRVADSFADVGINTEAYVAMPPFPEPASAVLLGLGLLGFFGIARRNRS